MPRSRLYIHPETEAEAIRMLNEGCSYTEIRMKLGLNDYAIVVIKRKAGMLPPEPQPRLASLKDLYF